MLTIAGGIILAVLFFYVVLPLVLGGLFCGIGWVGNKKELWDINAPARAAKEKERIAAWSELSRRHRAGEELTHEEENRLWSKI